MVQLKNVIVAVSLIRFHRVPDVIRSQYGLESWLMSAAVQAECLRAWAMEAGLNPAYATCQLCDLCKLFNLSVLHSHKMRIMTIMPCMYIVQI